jgi:uncharacterized protein
VSISVGLVRQEAEREVDMPLLIGKFVWFENVTTKPAEAQRFYGEVLGWKVHGWAMGPETYDMILTGDSMDTMIGGYSPAKEGAARWVSYVSVADVDASAKAVEKAGGKLLGPAIDVPTVGRMAQVADPAGAELFLYRSSDGENKADSAEPVTGAFFWNELWTPDAKAALAFYEQAFGYTHRDMDMGPGGVYRVLEHGGVPRAGILEEKGAKPHWLPYVAVDDCDATLARAKRGGATVEIPGTDIPTVGRFGVFRDPQGARLAVIKPSPR